MKGKNPANGWISESVKFQEKLVYVPREKGDSSYSLAIVLETATAKMPIKPDEKDS